jgi:hypothetical protein
MSSESSWIELGAIRNGSGAGHPPLKPFRYFTAGLPPHSSRGAHSHLM